VKKHFIFSPLLDFFLKSRGQLKTGQAGPSIFQWKLEFYIEMKKKFAALFKDQFGLVDRNLSS